MTEGIHHWSNSEGIGDLVDGSEPRPDVSDTVGGGEAEDVVQELLGWLDPVSSQFEAQKVDVIEAELLRIERAATSSSFLQKLTDSEEVLLNRSIIEHGVVHAGLVVLEPLHDPGLVLGAGHHLHPAQVGDHGGVREPQDLCGRHCAL